MPQARAYFDALDQAWSAALAPAATTAADTALRGFDQVRLREAAKLADSLVPRISADYLTHVQDALRMAAEATKREIAQVLVSRRNRSVTDPKVAAIRDRLSETGIAGFQMTADPLARLNEVLAPFRRELLEQRRTNGGARCFVVPPAKGEHWWIMKDFLRQQGIEQAISAYAGYRLELEGYAITYSHTDEDWYRRCYLDIGLAAPRTVQMHYDEDNLSAKSMFYLNDVGVDNGPFSHLAAARAEIASRSQLAFFKYLDYANNAFAGAKGAPTTVYNRPLFSTPELRAEFARLPAELQGSGGTGDDVLDGTPLSDFLLGNERKLTGPAGYLALFAGGETLHRGGVIGRGERWALQMIYKSPPSVAQKTARRLWSLRDVVPRLMNRIRGS
jgi:hypothetical protein